MTIARTGLGTTSLGAVGGARGTAAGALRILVEFLTTYDAAAVKQLEADLADLGKQEGAALNDYNQTAKALATNESKRVSLTKALNKELALQGKNQRAIKTQLKEITSIGAFTNEGKARLAALDLQLGGNSRLVNIYKQQQGLLRQQLLLEVQLAKRSTERAFIEENRLGTEKELTNQQRLKELLPQRLGGLALGAVGGIFGGAVIGVGFAAAQAMLDAIEQSLLDIIDPARHARENLDKVASAIISLAQADENAGDLGKGVQAFLDEFGIDADDRIKAILEQAAALKIYNDETERRKLINEQSAAGEKLYSEAIRDRAIALAEAAGVNKSIFFHESYANQQARLPFLIQAEKDYANALDLEAEKATKAAQAAAILEGQHRQQAAAAQLAAYAEQNLINALSSASSLASQSLFGNKIAELQVGGVQDSARTKALQAKIDALSGGGGGGSNSAQLRKIAEEEQLVRLRMKLRLLGKNIDLEKYSGKFLLEAINAKLAALDKEARAQDRLNRLLDLQFRMSQKLRRNEGESINDFLERRAQENRKMLTEQRDLEREAIEDHLKELQEKTQDEVKLKELAEQKKTAAQQSGSSKRLQDLQKQLAASKKADAEALQSKIQSLKDQQEAFEKQARDTVEIAAQTEQDKLRIAIGGMRTVQDLTAVSAQIQGTQAALGFLKSFGSVLVATGSMTQAELNSLIDRLQNTLTKYGRKEAQILSGGKWGGGPGGPLPMGFAGGGMIKLNNASSPFGSNIRFGEEGTEAAVILQHSIAKSLKNSQGVGQVGPFYMNRSDDWLRDRYQMKKLVREAVSEALR